MRVLHPTFSLKTLINDAQRVLPEHRRRPAYPALISEISHQIQTQERRPELSSEIKELGKPEHFLKERSTPALVRANAAGVDAPPGEDGRLSYAPNVASPIVSLVAEAGVEIILNILQDPRVKAAVSSLISEHRSAIEDKPPLVNKPTHATRESAPILIVGVSKLQAAELCTTYQGALQLSFWNSDDSRDELRQLVEDAGVVISIADRVSQAIDSSLSRAGKKYLRHTGGFGGLHGRLANIVMGTHRDPAA